MNEFDLIIAVFLSSGAGYLVGKHYERRKAKAAFENFALHVAHSATSVSAAMMQAIHRRIPDLNLNEFIKEVVNDLAKMGVQAVGMNAETNQVVEPDDNQAK